MNLNEHRTVVREPELRCDPVTGRWVVVAPERALRPLQRDGGSPRACPFCPGQEHETPGEVFAIRDTGTPADSPGWRLRVVPNKFPAVRGTSPTAFGHHEVVIETPEHIPTLQSDESWFDTLLAYRNRLLVFATNPAIQYTMIFKNVGAEAGASLRHTHSQLIATPFVPNLVAEELACAARYRAQHGRCVFCAHPPGERLVAETPHFVAFTAFAPRFAFELCVMPKSHSSRFESLEQEHELAGLLNRVLGRLGEVLGEPAYNLYLHTAPLRQPELPHYHWHIEILPRTSRPAGFEWGGGSFVVDVAPEQAAAMLRG